MKPRNQRGCGSYTLGGVTLMGHAWYVATTKPSAEDLAEKELLKQGFSVFNPRIRRRLPMPRGGHRLVVRPYLPGYILVRFNPNRDRWQSINGTRGVGKLFTCGKTPLHVRPGIVEELMALTTDGYAIDEKLDEVVKRTFKVGDLVKLSSGSFAGFEAEVALSSSDKVCIILEVFGRRTKTVVMNSAVEPVN